MSLYWNAIVSRNRQRSAILNADSVPLLERRGGKPRYFTSSFAENPHTVPCPLTSLAGPSQAHPTQRTPSVSFLMTQLNFLITGAGRGIGRGLARNLLRQGHRCFLTDVNEEELQHTLSLAAQWTSSVQSARSTAGSRSDTSPTPSDAPDVHGVVLDLRDRRATKAMIEQVTRVFDGRLDCLVNNAFSTPHVWREDGKMEDGVDVEDAEDKIMEQWDEKVAVGLTAPFYLSRLCVPLLSKKQQHGQGAPAAAAGSIINISSTRANQAEDDHEAYSAIKAGLLGLSRSMAVSLGHRHGIRVNSLVLGWISVDNENRSADEQGTTWEQGLTEEDHRWHPAGRVGRVEDVYKAVRFLVESDFVTGEEIVLDGGVTRKMVYPE